MVAGFIASSVAQLVLIVAGAMFLFDESEDDAVTVALLASWCALATLYVLVTVIVLGTQTSPVSDARARPGRIEISRPARLVSLGSTILASLIGVAAAIQLVALRGNPELGVIVGVVGVWAMILSWGLLHWGFAQGYYQTYYRAAEPPLRFPGTEHPRLTDFVYFSFTMGTSFAASDVEVRSPKLRWRVTWHSVISFFFNGLIIVFALNSILSAAQV